ncbi:glycoside hydrolase family 2 TIM barrel-domain containing protein [Streptococcus hongkongensis]
MKKRLEEINYQIVDKVGRRQDFNSHWRFLYGDFKELEKVDFDDSYAQEITLPHDFSRDQPYTKNGEAESGYKLGGIGWYRKGFWIAQSLKDCRICLTVEGAYLESQVFVNGCLVGEHLNGYLAFTYDISDFVTIGDKNTIAIRCHNPIPNSRWYSGSGLYRSVTLSVIPFDHIKEESVQIDWTNQEEVVTSHQPLQLEISGTLSDLKEVADFKDYQLMLDIWSLNRSGKSGRKLIQGLYPLKEAIRDHSFLLSLNIVGIELWSPETPNLYQFRLSLLINQDVKDDITIETGFRMIQKKPKRGLYLNGQAYKLKGVCLHHDQGGLGACAYPDAIERQLVLLKQMGANAIRLAHNPSARIIKTLSDRLGFLVIEEAFDTWLYAKNENIFDFSRYFTQPLGRQNCHYLQAKVDSRMTWGHYILQNMIIKSRHHPSILAWSIGNELLEGFSGDVSSYPEILNQLLEWVLEVDRHHFITIGDNKVKDPQFVWYKVIEKIMDNLSQVEGNLSLIGLNYAKGKDYDCLQVQHPTWFLYGSETVSAVNSRSVYHLKHQEQSTLYELTSYDQSTVEWGDLASQAWYDVITRDFVAGEFVWTGFDYLGEPTPWNNIAPGVTGTWPSPKHSYFGIIDTAGFPKDSYYFYQSQWATQATCLHLLPIWDEKVITQTATGHVDVVVYSNAASVRLFLFDQDGQKKDLGEKHFSKRETTSGHTYQILQPEENHSISGQNLYLTWQVPFIKGQLKAIAYDDKGRVISETTGRNLVRGFGPAHHLQVREEAILSGNQKRKLLYLVINLMDRNDEIVLTDDCLVHVSVSGPAELIALDNANPIDHSFYNVADKKTFKGKLLAILRLNGQAGQIEVTVSSKGKTSAKFNKPVRILETSQLAIPPLAKLYQELGPLKYEQGVLSFDAKTNENQFTKSINPATISSQQTLNLLVKSGDDIILPQYFQPVATNGKLLSLVLPIQWDFSRTKDSTYFGRSVHLNQEVHIQLTVYFKGVSYQLNQDISQMAKTELVKTGTGDSLLRYQYDTVQNIAAISLNDPSNLEEDVFLRLYLSKSQCSYHVNLKELNKKGSYYYFDKAYPAMMVTLQFAKGKKVKSEHIGIWTVTAL